MITQGTLSTGSDYGISSVKNLLINTGLFTLISDTGTGSSHVVVLKYLDNTHYLKIYYSGGSCVALLKNDFTTSLVASWSLTWTGDPTYKVLLTNNRFVLVVGSNVVCFGVQAGSHNVLGIQKSSTYMTTAIAADDVEHSGTNIVYPKRTDSLYEIMSPIFLDNAAGTNYIDAPLQYVYQFKNAATIAMGTVVNLLTDQYIVSKGWGSGEYWLFKS